MTAAGFFKKYATPAMNPLLTQALKDALRVRFRLGEPLGIDLDFLTVQTKIDVELLRSRLPNRMGPDGSSFDGCFRWVGTLTSPRI
jgi:hypothetical protein